MKTSTAVLQLIDVTQKWAAVTIILAHGVASLISNQSQPDWQEVKVLILAVTNNMDVHVNFKSHEQSLVPKAVMVGPKV